MTVANPAHTAGAVAVAAAAGSRRTLLSRLTLLSMLLCLVLSQLVTVGLAHSYLDRLEGGGDSYSQWSRYLARTPDVLFVGDSRMREDIDVQAVAQLLSDRLGRNVTVGHLGYDSAQPRAIAAILYRVAHRSPRPKLIVYGMSEYQYGTAVGWDPTFDFWNMEWPPDPGYYKLTLEIDNNRNALAIGYVVPAVANANLIGTGIKCTMHDATSLAARVTNLPIEGSEPLGYCDAPVLMRDSHMDPSVLESIHTQYRQIWSAKFKFSNEEAGFVQSGFKMAASAGIPLIFIVPPVYDLETLNPTAYAEFESRTSMIARSLNAPRIDLHDQVRDNYRGWADPAHLNGEGALELAPIIARSIVPYYPLH
jgi:hypothetical protein